MEVVVSDMNYSVLDSLHRPFHRPLWIVKWVSYYICQRAKSRNRFIHCKDLTGDFYFNLLEWMHLYYPKDNDGIPSKESIEEVRDYFSSIEKKYKEIELKEILSKNREKGIETKVYTTYKAASYYLNLADDKLHFVDKHSLSCCWEQRQLTKAVLRSGISIKDRKLYYRQILKNDCHFFLSMCLLQKPTRKYGLKVEEEIYKFMQKYYPISNFDYTRQSHGNYYVVRKKWVELLCAINDKGTLSRTFINCILEDDAIADKYKEIANCIREYTGEIKQRSVFIKQKKLFVSTYQKLASKSEDKSNFVNLYDISKEMRMSYQRFQNFLSRFYQEERMVRNIFFVNIVSTIEQRKRFYIGKSPVMKIKISKYYGA